MKKYKILYLSLGPTLKGPFPKIAPLLITALEVLGCQITKRAWGSHSDNESLLQKFVGRLGDLLNVLLTLIRRRYDILYVMTTLDEYSLFRDIPLLLATYLFPVKKVLIEHGSKTAPLVNSGHSLYKFLTRLLIRLSDAILLLSNEELESWKKFETMGRYYLVDNPFLPSSDTKSGKLTGIIQEANSHPILLFAGRLIKAKGIFDLLNAMPMIIRRFNCHLLIAGDGVEKEEVISFIKRANLENHITLLGYVDSDRLSIFYRSSSIFILPTYFGEGFPTVIAEAMSFGLPIITTPIRGACDHLREGTNALFIKPQDPDAIASAVIRLLNDPKLCIEMGRANLTKVKEFKPEKIAPRYFEIFSELLGSDK